MAGHEDGTTKDRIEAPGQWAIDRARRLQFAYAYVAPERWPDEVKMAASLLRTIEAYQRVCGILIDELA